MRSPRPWQPPIISWLKQPRQDRAGLAVDMRLGKIYLTSCWLAARNPRFVLIVAPISSHLGWQTDLTADGFNPLILEGTREERVEQVINRVKSGEPTVFVTNAESLYKSVPYKNRRKAVPTDIALLDWEYVVWDEWVVLADPKNRASEIATEHLAKARCKLMLSGEYVPHHVQQVYQPMKFLLGSFMGHRNFWRWRSENFRQNGYDWIPKDVHAIRAAFAEHAYILSRKAAGVEETWIRETRYCDMPDSTRAEYERIEDNLSVKLPERIKCEACRGKGWIPKPDEEEMCGHCYGDGYLDQRQTNLIMVTLNWLAQMAGGYPKDFPHLVSEHKSRLLLEAVNEFAFEPLVVSFRYNAELYACYDMLRKDRIRCDYMVGDTPKPTRDSLIRSWSKGTGPRVLLCQQKVMLYGMDMSASDTLFRYSLPYSWNEISQGSCRIVNTTKRNPLLCLDLCCKDTTDQDIINLVKDQRGVSRLFMQRLKERVVGRIRLRS